MFHKKSNKIWSRLGQIKLGKGCHHGRWCDNLVIIFNFLTVNKSHEKKENKNGSVQELITQTLMEALEKGLIIDS